MAESPRQHPAPRREPPGTALPAAVLGLALSLLFPFAWDRLLPRHQGDPVWVRLGPPGAAAPLEIPGEAMVARLEGYTREVVPLDTLAAFFDYREAAEFVFPLASAGVYTIDGLARDRAARPLELALNGRTRSKVAFWRAEHPEPQRLAARVALPAGQTHVLLTGPGIEERSLALRLRRERPLDAPYALGLAVAALAGLLLARLGARRLALPAAARLGLLAALGGAFALIPLLALRTRTGSELVALGHKNPELVERLDSLEAYLASEAHARARRAGAWSVAVLGDSTHYFDLPEEHQMLQELGRALPAPERSAIELYGLSSGGLSAWDYYMLVNRLAAERAHLVVLPVNGSSFSRGWLANPGYRFSILERYLLASEYWRCRDLDVEGRTFDWKRLVLRRLDLRLGGGRIEPLARGVKVYYERERDLAVERFNAGLPAALLPIPAEWQPRDLTPSLADKHIHAGHPLFQVFHRINRLAFERGIQVLYYSVQEQSLARGGRGPNTSREDFLLIERELTRDPGVHYLTMPEDNPPELFSDSWIHLTPHGMEQVASRIASRVTELAAEHGRERRARF